VPPSLRLEDATPTPLSVYGSHASSWELAYSMSKRDCVTLESHDRAVATITRNEVTGAEVVVPVGSGVTTISVGVKGNGSLTVPLTVTGLP
jgi:hypothetical protein